MSRSSRVETVAFRDDRGTFARITEGVYWLVVIDVLLVLAALPTLVVWMLLARDASNIPLYTASSLFLLPAVAAAFFAWRKRAGDPDPVPIPRFLRGYRVNLLDSLRIGAPAIAVLTVLGINLTYGGAVGTEFLTIPFAVMAVAVVLLTTRALAIASTFSFRIRDVARLSVFTLLTMPLRTLSMLSIWVAVVGISLFVGDYAFLFTASLLTFVMWHSEKPVIDRVRERFVADGDPRDDGGRPVIDSARDQ